LLEKKQKKRRREIEKKGISKSKVKILLIWLTNTLLSFFFFIIIKRIVHLVTVASKAVELLASTELTPEKLNEFSTYITHYMKLLNVRYSFLLLSDFSSTYSCSCEFLYIIPFIHSFIHSFPLPFFCLNIIKKMLKRRFKLDCELNLDIW